jgi:hypothetical protein
MLRALFVAVAVLTLSACASLPMGSASSSLESFDADAAPIEAPVAEWGARQGYVDVSMLDRRAFTPSPGRRPEWQAMYVTAVDRRFRGHMRRRPATIRRRRRAAIRSVLLTS